MTPPATPSFLDHAGDCARLLRETGTAAASGLGAPADWAAELRLLTGLMLGASEAMFVAWGPQRIVLYNDAYASIIGAQHPAALGAPMQQVWPDIWEQIGPLVDRVFAGHSVQMDDIALPMQRSGGVEEAHFSFGYHPVRDDCGTVVGLFCVCRETTVPQRAQRQRDAAAASQWRLFEQAPGFMAILHGPAHEIEFVNQAFIDTFGERDFVGRTLAQALPEALEQGFAQRFDAVWASAHRHQGHRVPLTLLAGGQQASLRVLDFTLEPLLDEKHAISGIFVQGHDLTSLHLSQQSARASNLRYATLLDSMGESLIMLDTDFRVLQINREGLRMDGRPIEQIVGRSHWEAWPSLLGTPVEQAYRQAMATSEPRHLEHLFPSETASDLWLDTSVYPVPDGLALVCRDITEVKRAEAALQLSEARFKAAVSAVGVMWVKNAQGQIDSEQRGWGALTGQTREQYQGDGWAQAIHPDDVQPTLVAWRQAVAQRRHFEWEHRVRTAAGEWRRYAVRAVPVFEVDGALREWVGVHIDVTEARRSAEALREADRRKDEFLAILAHELRNPLAPIRTAASVLNNPALTPEELAASRNIINRQIRHMAWLLDDLLDISRVSAGRMELEQRPHRLQEIVTAAVETARSLIDSKQQVLTIDLPRDGCSVHVDEVRMAQVFSNLLLNAAKYSEPGGRIRLGAHPGEHELTIEVSDDGVGITPEQLPYVFDMFSQLRSATDRSEGGLGIGLALSRGLVELHGGRLEAASAGLGRGATFRVHLPLPSFDTPPALSDENPARVAVSDHHPLCILIADDNSDAADSLGLLLALERHQVHVATDGTSALALATQVRPQVAVLDIGMPGLDGYDVARRLRLAPGGAEMLILALTGWGQQEDQRRALAAGFDDHYTKPVDPGALIQRINAWRLRQPVTR